jgi:hypothetical protein
LAEFIFLLNLDPAVIQSSMINSDSVYPVLIMNIQLDKSDNLRKGNLSEIFVLKNVQKDIHTEKSGCDAYYHKT